ncbi:unnamed protein product [Spirodela intermedia]|uniref:Glycosyltransferases n=1 Tax=Spirodela intermedia TaxID=51605 RepID=A0A7I8IUY6_SPIIN|nr:unnamed protein product [Spirodela intermedia]CAA6661806.1 unnamed protein product [Spirodela intermedia]
MYRHLVFGETFSDPQAEIHHQRNIALNHIEDHRLSGIVHFSCLSDAYDLQFFDEIRGIEAFGTWPAASVSASEKQVVVEGPVCRSSRIVGWYLAAPFAFNSSILWDPDRWVRPTNLPDISQDSVRFLQEVVAEDDTKLRAFPSPDCSRILTWRLRSPGGSPFPAATQTQEGDFEAQTARGKVASFRPYFAPFFPFCPRGINSISHF